MLTAKLSTWMAVPETALRLKITALLLAVLSLSVASSSQTTDSSSAPTAATKTVSVVTAVLILKTSVSSKKSTVGQAVTAVTKKPLTLPDGETLPKGTQLQGSVIAVVKHSKATPNGAVALDFTKALPKGKEPINVTVRITKLSPSAEDQDGEKTELPNSNGHMAESAGNSGGVSQVVSQENDHTNIHGKVPVTSTIDGVFLSPTNKGAGAAFAREDDVYLDSGVQLTVLVGFDTTAAK